MRDQKIETQGQRPVQSPTILLAMAVMASLTFLVLTLGCNKSKETEQSKNARARDENRARILKEGIQGLNLAQNVQDTKGLRDELKDLSNKIPEGNSYTDQLTICVGFLEQINRAATEGNLREIPQVAAQGLRKAKASIAELIAKAKEELKEGRTNVKTGSMSKASLAINRSQVYSAAAHTFKVTLILFQEIMGLYVLNGSKDVRFETFQAIADTYSTLNPINPEGAKPLKEMMQSSYAEEDSSDNKSRMGQILSQLDLPLEPGH